ncbi:MAG: hypothetical protein ACR2PZ_07705 [Pseudomonadales bacterium]
MSNTEHLIEQQVIKHHAKLKHVDELFERLSKDAEVEKDDPLLAALEEERHTLAKLLNRMNDAPPESWQEAADSTFGPMGVWNTMARLLEKTLERIEHK